MIVISTVSGKIVEQNPEVYYTVSRQNNSNNNLKCDACGARIPVYNLGLEFSKQLTAAANPFFSVCSPQLTRVEKIKQKIGMNVLVSDTAVVHTITSSGSKPLPIMNGVTNKLAFNLDDKRKTANIDDACAKATAEVTKTEPQGNVAIFLDDDEMQEALQKQRKTTGK